MNNNFEVKVERYFEDSDSFIELFASVLDRFVNSLNDPELEQKQTQLIKVSRTIDQLKDLSVPVPDELRNLKLNLLAEIERKLQIREEAEQFVNQLGDLLTHFESAYIIKTPTTRTRKHRSKLPRTKVEDFEPEIIFALRDLGGNGTPKEVKDIIEEKMKDRLLPGDFERNASGSLVWKKSADKSRRRLIDAGILRSDSPRHVWELSEDHR